METLQWWIYLILAGIVFSGYMTIKTAQEENKIDQRYIEHEGEVFIERMKEERKKRKDSLQVVSSNDNKLV